MLKNLLHALKQKVLNFLESLAEENKKQFGNKRLSCCSSHQEHQSQTVKK